MTAVEWLEKELLKIPFVNVIDVFEQSKQMEKEQSKKDYKSGVIDGFNSRTLPIETNSEQYYNETYGSKGSDKKKINLVEIPQEQLEKERNPNYKYFSIDDATSSQTEISDEEIEKAVMDSMDYVYLNPNDSLIFHQGWMRAIKWYREQLKKK